VEGGIGDVEARAISRQRLCELVDVRPADLVHLFDLNREPILREHVIGRAFLAFLRCFCGLRADRINAAINAHIADLHLVGNPARLKPGWAMIAHFSNSNGGMALSLSISRQIKSPAPLPRRV
jgi:hypothetical protein